MTRTVLLTLGRFPKSLTLARIIANAGHRVVVADPFRWHLCSPSTCIDKCVRVTAPNLDPDGWRHDILELINKESITDVIPCSEEVDHVSTLAPLLPSETRLLSPSNEQVTHWQDKSKFISFALNKNLTVPSSCAADSAEAYQLVASTDCVLKPLRGCSGIDVSFIGKGERVPKALNPMLLQQHIKGELISTTSWVVRGQPLTTICYRGRVFSGTVAIGFEHLDCQPSVRAWISQFLAGSGFSGFISFDLIIDGSGVVWGIECNPRLSSGVHFFNETSLANALFDDRITPSKQPVGTRKQWGYNTLTEAYIRLFKVQPIQFIRHFFELFTARDVVWSWKDPMPFLLMTPTAFEILWPALKEGVPIAEASLRDVAPHWQNLEDNVIFGESRAP